MSQPLKGKTALVTGASRGIGRAIAVRLARDGALVAIHYGKDAQAAKETHALVEASGGKGFIVSADLASTAKIAAMFAQLDSELERRTGAATIDILVNNAGVVLRATLEETTEAQFDQLFALNTKAVFFVTQHAIRRMKSGGRIINIASLGSKNPRPHAIAYSASKGAVDSFTLSLAADLGSRGITVNAVAPGMTMTDMTSTPLQNEELMRAVVSSTVLGRLGEPDDIAGVVAFLASEDGRWVTGQTILATGGMEL